MSQVGGPAPMKSGDLGEQRGQRSCRGEGGGTGGAPKPAGRVGCNGAFFIQRSRLGMESTLAHLPPSYFTPGETRGSGRRNHLPRVTEQDSCQLPEPPVPCGLGDCSMSV